MNIQNPKEHASKQTDGKQERTKQVRKKTYTLPILTDIMPIKTETFFTDGGCKNDIATWSFTGTNTTMRCGPICLNPIYPNIYYNAETHTSNTAEITAAIECLNFIIKHKQN